MRSLEEKTEIVICLGGIKLILLGIPQTPFGSCSHCLNEELVRA